MIQLQFIVPRSLFGLQKLFHSGARPAGCVSPIQGSQAV